MEKGADLNARGNVDNTPLHGAAKYGHLDIVEYLVEKGANLSATTRYGKTPLDYAIEYGTPDVAKYLESKGAHRSRRSIDNDNPAIEVNQATSGASKPSSWISVFANTIAGAVEGVAQFISSPFKSAIDMKHSQTSKAMTTQGVDVNGTLLLLDVFIRKITGQKYISTADQPTISLQEAERYASYIINGFEKVLNETAFKSGISVTNLNFDPIKPQSAIVGQLRNGKFSEISKILYSSAKQACPECKQTKRFMGRLETCIEGFLDKKELSSIGQKLRIEEAKQIRKRELCSSANFITDNPKTYLNDPTIDKQLQGSCHTISS